MDPNPKLQLGAKTEKTTLKLKLIQKYADKANAMMVKLPQTLHFKTTNDLIRIGRKNVRGPFDDIC